jgi:WD40 repeat protein
MDSIIKFWDYEEDLLKEKKTSRALTLNQKEAQVASVKVADNRYRWQPFSEVNFHESVKKFVLGVSNACLVPADAPRIQQAELIRHSRGAPGRGESEQRLPSPKGQQQASNKEDLPSAVVFVTDAGVMHTADLTSGRRDDTSNQHLQTLTPLYTYTQVQGSPVALLQSPCEGQERVILWVSSMTWAVVCVCDGTVPTLSTAGPAAALESTVRYTAAAWVPWRPSAFVLGSRDGGIHVWDLLADTSRAVYKQKFGVLEIVAFDFIDGGQYEMLEGQTVDKELQRSRRLLLVGNSDGELQVSDVTDVKALSPFSPAEAASFSEGVHLWKACPTAKKAQEFGHHA